MVNWLKLYHRSPYPVRVLAASIRGYQLRRWRYGAESERLIAEVLERDTWTTSRWREWQHERLTYVLQRAARDVPVYHQQWQRRRRQGDRASPAYLENWPLLEKDSVRQHPRAFVADDCDTRHMYHEHTSGTTGTSLDLWWSRETVRTWYALFEARTRHWNGVSRTDRWAILGGQLVARVSQTRPPFWVWNHGLRQLYMSSYHLAPRFIPYYLDSLRDYRVNYLLGYPSSIYALAQEALRLGCNDLKMQAAITNAEPLFDYQREVIAEAFNCPVRETYGMAEIVAAAAECEAGSLHLWPEVGLIEVASSESAGVEGNAGELVCTGLLNADMPLIRYRVGDRGRLANDSMPSCACERGLPQLAAVEGRTDDVLVTADGRRIGRLDPVFKARLPVREAQIIQEAADRVRVRYVPATDYTLAAGKSIVARLQERMGPVNVILEPVETIPRTSNGKFRSVINNMPLHVGSIAKNGP